VDAGDLVPQQTIDKRIGTFNSNEPDIRPDLEIKRRPVHVFATRELGALPTPLQPSLDTALPLIADRSPVAEAGGIPTEVALRTQVTHPTHQAAVRNGVNESLPVHGMPLSAVPTHQPT
jgi:hypothetical protein